MLTPFIVSSIFVLAVVLLCFLRPNAGRLFLGFFFLAMALGVNGYFVLKVPHGYVAYGSEALLPAYRILTTTIIAYNPVLFGLLLMIFETTMGLCLLSKQRYVTLGLVGTMVFLLAIAPVSLLQLPWLGLLLGQGHLLQHQFDQSLLDLVKKKEYA